MPKKAPYSPEQQQEAISRSQFEQHLHEYGWIVDPTHRDIGEDFYVRVCDSGDPVGITFMVQLKSTADVTKLVGCRDHITYRCKVSSIEQWERSAFPVFLVVWDVNRKTGHWIGIGDIVSDLSRRRSTWRKQRTAAVHIPLGNRIDDAGLARIRERVARHFSEGARRGQNLKGKIVFHFPKTEGADVAFRALQQHLKAGDEVEIDGEFVKEVQFPYWWNWFFPQNGRKIAKMKLSPVPSPDPLPVRLEMLPCAGEAASMDYVELRVEKRGSEQATLSNEQQDTPLYFRFVFESSSNKFAMNVLVRGPGKNVSHTKDVLRFVSALAAGGRLRLTFLRHERTLEARLPRGSISPADHDLLDLVDKLCLIQSKTGSRLKIGSDWSITRDDVQTANLLVEVFQTGRVGLRNVTFNLSLEKSGVVEVLRKYDSNHPVTLSLENANSEANLLGVRISLGPVRQTVTGWLENEEGELRRSIADMGSDDVFEARLVKASVFQEYAHWLPDHS